MSRIFLISLLFFLPPSGKDIIQKMYYQYGGKWYQTFTFRQTTDIYRGDSLRASQTWYEFIRFPDRFRMDFGDADSGNAAIFRGDSCYRYRNGHLLSTTINNNEGLIFLMGGMYFYPLGRTLDILRDSLHYNLDRMHEDSYETRPVYVIGADQGDTITNQIWVDQEKLFIVRMIRSSPGRTLDARFAGYKPFGMGWSPMTCTFYVNGRLVQVETYQDARADVELDSRIFDPSKLVHSH